MTTNEIYLKLKSYFEDTALPKVKSFTGAIGAQMGKAGAAIAGVNAIFGQMPGKIGAAINGVGRLATAAMTMGPVGAVITGASLAFQWFQDRAEKAAQAVADAAKRMAERIKARSDAIRNFVEEGISKSLDHSAARAEKAIRAFNNLASAYMKVAAAKDATAKAGDDAEIAKLRQQKTSAMSEASGGNKAITGAQFDVKIAERQAKATAEAHDRAVRTADAEAQNAAKRLDIAQMREVSAAQNLADANDRLAKARTMISHNDGGAWEKRMAAIREKAAKALSDAQQARITAEADATAATEKLKQAQLNQAAALADASAAVISAKDTLKNLEEAQIKSINASIEAAQKSALKEARDAEVNAAKNDAQRHRAGVQAGQERAAEAQAKINAARNERANAWAIYKNPEALRRLVDDQREERKQQNRFRRDSERLQRRNDWRTAKLGQRDELVRRMILAQEEEDNQRKELKAANQSILESKVELVKISNLLERSIGL